MTNAKHQRPAAISFTDAAKAHIQDMFKNAPEGTIAIKLGLKNAGCAGMSYVMNFTNSVEPLDEVVPCGEVNIVIEAKSLLFLLGTRMDYQIDKLRSGFVFENPNQTDACGCGESVKLIPAASDDAPQQSTSSV
ncbi:MAG: iron-sulfur cluster assembly accessory protein [Pseudomonadota bacterium]